MSKLKIGVFGSAPDAPLVDCDVGYFVNFSAQSFDPNAVVRRISSRVCMMSVTARFPKRSNKSFTSHEKASELLQKNHEFNFDRTIVVASQQDANSYTTKVLEDEEFLLHSDTEALLEKTVGSKPPYWDRHHFTQGIFKRPSKAFRILLRSNLDSKRLSPYLRPSMGAMALAYATTQHNAEDAEFVVSGVSFAARNVHAVHGAILSANDWFAPHVIADQYCIAQLSHRNIIRFVPSQKA